ncbi:hypothetical protein SAMN05660484_01732 [Eubacterium ruminantium]|uniref:Zinc-ribbon domain-containing protein n=1 Tax=Eubacterium ruminantium TaxID=42322 RepID=A0A1T4NWE9_9FIRM|nr:hypothetical protein [Eubacterium ruminantium]SCW56087.1 hypothetical protein SAMN05660484_01732 [Eubacterium ruminantium]SJZ83604.1 hypothetical protein SAMN02745110_01733 [Eubacterium ruminantium]
MKCPYCGAEIPITLSSCPKCGKSIDDSAQENFIQNAGDAASTFNNQNQLNTQNFDDQAQPGGAAGFNQGMQPNGAAGFNQGMQPNGAVGFNQGMQPNGAAGFDPGMQPNGAAGFNLGMQPNGAAGFDPGMQPNGAAGFNPGMQPNGTAGFNQGMQPNGAQGFGQPVLSGKPALEYKDSSRPNGQNMGVSQPVRETIQANMNNNNPAGKTGNPKMLKYACIAVGLIIIIGVVILIISQNSDKPDNKKYASGDPTTDIFGVTTEDIFGMTTEESTWVNQPYQPDEDVEEYKVGETWTVDDQWTVTVLGVEKIDERNEYSDKNPKAVYKIKYAYSNNGFEPDYSDGLYISLDGNVVDNKGVEGYSYPASIDFYPRRATVGSTCICYNAVGVENEGTFKVYVERYDTDNECHKACFVMEPGAKSESFPTSTKSAFDEKNTLKVGETWKVDDQWEITINGVKEVTERNGFSELNPEAVYLIDYTYKNLGYESKYEDGLYVSITDTIIDNKGFLAYNYPGNVENHPNVVAVGETCNAQACVGVDNAGQFKITISKYDSKEERRTQSFIIDVK